MHFYIILAGFPLARAIAGQAAATQGPTAVLARAERESATTDQACQGVFQSGSAANRNPPARFSLLNRHLPRSLSLLEAEDGRLPGGDRSHLLVPWRSSGRISIVAWVSH